MLKEDMPAWIVFFDPLCRKHVVSGGDDCVMRVWKLSSSDGAVDETGEHNNETEDDDSLDLILVSSNRSIHTAGVTSGQWHPLLSDIFVTGSYDESVRVWDQRDVSKPLLEIPTGRKFICCTFLFCIFILFYYSYYYYYYLMCLIWLCYL